MKTSKIFMTTLVALTMAACSNDNDWVDQSSNPDVIAPDAYASFPSAFPTHRRHVQYLQIRELQRKIQ